MSFQLTQIVSTGNETNGGTMIITSRTGSHPKPTLPPNRLGFLGIIEIVPSIRERPLKRAGVGEAAKMDKTIKNQPDEVRAHADSGCRSTAVLSWVPFNIFDATPQDDARYGPLSEMR